MKKEAKSIKYNLLREKIKMERNIFNVWLQSIKICQNGGKLMIITKYVKSNFLLHGIILLPI